MKSLLAPVALLVIAVAPAPTFANPFETKLANGLRVIVKEDRRAPTAGAAVLPGVRRIRRGRE